MGSCCNPGSVSDFGGVFGAACHRSVRDAKDEVMGSSDSGAGARDESATLLVRFAAGEPEAFVAFYRLNVSAVVGFFLRRTGDREVTADLTAEVFAAALIAAPRYDPEVRPALAWLHGIASHKLADSRRRGRVEDEARRRLALEPLLLNDEALDRVEEMASSHARRDALDGAVAGLPVEQREAVLARVVDERSYPEIAAEMACSEMVVRQRVSRGLKTLRSRLEEPE
jgi:RNA polymerase sigma factor (sigma-70 family)